MRIRTLRDGSRWIDWDNEYEAKVWWALTGFWVPPITYDMTESGTGFRDRVRHETLNHAFNRRAE